MDITHLIDCKADFSAINECCLLVKLELVKYGILFAIVGISCWSIY